MPNALGNVVACAVYSMGRQGWTVFGDITMVMVGGVGRDPRSRIGDDSFADPVSTTRVCNVGARAIVGLRVRDGGSRDGAKPNRTWFRVP